MLATAFLAAGAFAEGDFFDQNPEEPPPPQRRGLLYLVNRHNYLGTVDVDTQEFNVIGQISAPLLDLAFSPEGELYGVAPDGLYRIDRRTAAVEYIGGENFDGSRMNALDFGQDGTLYAAGRNSTLYTVDMLSGKATEVGEIGFNSSGDLAFTPDGQLYLSTTKNSLVWIDLSSGAGTEIGSFGQSEILGMALNVDGTMYGYSYDNIFTIDMSNGRASPAFGISSSQLLQSYGSAFYPIPEPNSALMALFAGGGIGVLRRRRR